jgi:glycine cleavage system H protein
MKQKMPTVHHRYATVHGRGMFYREAGPPGAPDVVLLHGFPASSFMFRYLIPLLAARYHVIAPTIWASACPTHRRPASSAVRSTPGPPGLLRHLAARAARRRCGGPLANRGGTMPDIPADLRYSPDHLWARPGDRASLVRVGVTDFAQQSLGDVVDVSVPAPGGTVEAGQPLGDIESVKSLNDLIAPVTGTVATRNDALAQAPELVNSDPYGEGWMADIEADTATLSQQLASLLDASGYRDLIGKS